ncbi:hypothetical protein LG293_16700 (plasmid) [Citricoccus nitrophenolicus]
MKIKTATLAGLAVASALLLTGCGANLASDVEGKLAEDMPVASVTSPADGEVVIETTLEYGFLEAVQAEQICNEVRGVEGLNKLSVTANNGATMINYSGSECEPV